MLEGMCNTAEYALKDSRKMAGQLEGCFYLKKGKHVLYERTLEYCFWGGRFHIIPQSYKFYHGLCFDISFKFC